MVKQREILNVTLLVLVIDGGFKNHRIQGASSRKQERQGDKFDLAVSNRDAALLSLFRPLAASNVKQYIDMLFTAVLCDFYI